jgi:hypothetical protein
MEKISAPNFGTLILQVNGTSPLVQNRFPAKVQVMLEEKMKAGSTASSKKTRKARDFDSDFEEAQHKSDEGWVGVPASAFRNACIDACRMVGFKMTHAKMSIFFEADGYDAQDGTPLVKIIADEPEKVTHPVRNATGVVDLRARPMWRKWSINLRVKFDQDQFTQNDVLNLLLRAGQQVGIGEGRPYSKSSNGMGWGTFLINEEAYHEV